MSHLPLITVYSRRSQRQAKGKEHGLKAELTLNYFPVTDHSWYNLLFEPCASLWQEWLCAKTHESFLDGLDEIKPKVYTKHTESTQELRATFDSSHCLRTARRNRHRNKNISAQRYAALKKHCRFVHCSEFVSTCWSSSGAHNYTDKNNLFLLSSVSQFFV